MILCTHILIEKTENARGNLLQQQLKLWLLSPLLLLLWREKFWPLFRRSSYQISFP